MYTLNPAELEKQSSGTNPVTNIPNVVMCSFIIHEFLFALDCVFL